jgi:branched-chain amino acid transport system permease protein
MFLQLIVNSFSLGSFYALIALGFSLIFGVTRAFNLAHGELILVSGYLAYGLCKGLGIPVLCTLPLCMLALAFVTMLLHKLLRHIPEPFELNTLVVTFGLAMVLQNVMLFAFSANFRLLPQANFPLSLPEITPILNPNQVILIGLSLLATALTHALLHKTFLGKALRATIQEREAARLAGIPVERMGLIAFALGGMLIGLAGPLYGQSAYLQPFAGPEPTSTAIIITIFAGVGRIRGILLGGWILGFVESSATLACGTSWRDMVSAILLIALLLLRPEGLLTFRSRRESKA